MGISVLMNVQIKLIKGIGPAFLTHGLNLDYKTFFFWTSSICFSITVHRALPSEQNSQSHVEPLNSSKFIMF